MRLVRRFMPWQMHMGKLVLFYTPLRSLEKCFSNLTISSILVIIPCSIDFLFARYDTVKHYRGHGISSDFHCAPFVKVRHQ